MGLTVNANTQQVTIVRGDEETIRFTVKNAAGVAYDVSSNTFKFTVKASLDDAIADAKFQRQSPAANGIDLTNAASGIVDVVLVAANTSTLAGLYYYDLEMVESGKVHTIARGIFQVLKDVTTPGAAPSSSGVIPDFPDGLSLDALYLQSPNGNYWKLTVDDTGATQLGGPSTTIPF